MIEQVVYDIHGLTGEIKMVEESDHALPGSKGRTVCSRRDGISR